MSKLHNACFAIAAVALGAALFACGSANGSTSGDPPASGTSTSGANTGAPAPSTSTAPSGVSTNSPTANAPTAPAAPAGSPIDAPNETWTWVDVPGSTCLDGSQTGFGVNLTDKSNDVLIFLEGGGACWDGESCWGPVQTAFYVATGYSKVEFATDPQIPLIYTLNRDDLDNPFKDKNIVYVPYCTGDSFAGNNVTTLSFLGIDHDTHFSGYENLGLYLDRITATFPTTSRVWLSGDSAGGFGSAFNFGRVQAAFPKARVDVLDDSGQPIAPDPARWALWKSAWNMQLPAGCATCGTTPGGFIDYYSAQFPQSRFGLISFEYDTIISPFMNITLDQFHTELYATGDHIDATWSNGHYFFIAGASHVGLATPTPDLKTWVTKMVTDDATWASVRQ